MNILGIETAIQGGSLALLKDDKELDFWIGDHSVSKAEDVLEQISLILERNGLNKVDLIAVSNGPGSSTGIRIGSATAKGLKMSQGCEIIEVSVFDSIICRQKKNAPILVAIPVGSRQIAWQVCKTKLPADTINLHNSHRFKIGDISDIENILETSTAENLVLHQNIIDICGNFIRLNTNRQIEILDRKLAALVGVNGWKLYHENVNYASDNVFT